MKSKLIINIERELIYKAKEIAKKNTTLSKLVSNYFIQLTKFKTEILSPILNDIAGIEF